MDPLLVRPSALFAKIETTKGTPVAVTGTDGQFNVFDPVVTESTGMTIRPAAASAGKLRGVAEAIMATATFRLHLETGVGGAVPAWASTFLPACGYVESGGVFTRTLDTSLQKTLTIVHYKGAGTVSIKQTLAGAVGTFRIAYKNGKAHDVLFDFIGKYMSEETSTLLSPTLPTTLPPRGFQTLTVGGTPLRTPECTYDAGCQRLLIEAENDAGSTGYLHGVVTDYNPTLAAEPYQEALSVRDWRADFIASVERGLSIVVGVANPITLATTALQLNASPQFGSREQVYTRQLNFNDNAANGATLTFAA